jgi:hypothetical protein
MPLSLTVKYGINFGKYFNLRMNIKQIQTISASGQYLEKQVLIIEIRKAGK